MFGEAVASSGAGVSVAVVLAGVGKEGKFSSVRSVSTSSSSSSHSAEGTTVGSATSPALPSLAPLLVPALLLAPVSPHRPLSSVSSSAQDGDADDDVGLSVAGTNARRLLARGLASRTSSVSPARVGPFTSKAFA